MSAETPLAAVGSMLSTQAELDALPPYTVLLGDPEGRSRYERDRRLSIQKRPGDDASSGDWWYPAWDSDIFNALTTGEVVDRFHLGPFLVLYLPDSEPAAEAAA